jgi:hypothetical protein
VAAPETVPPELEQLARGDETTSAARGAPVEVEEADGRGAARASQSEHPAPDEGGEVRGGRSWQEQFASADELYRRFKDVDRLRGRQANDVGALRRQADLYTRTIRLLGVTSDPFSRQALVQAAELIPHAAAHRSIEEMLAAGERALEEVAHAV